MKIPCGATILAEMASSNCFAMNQRVHVHVLSVSYASFTYVIVFIRHYNHNEYPAAKTGVQGRCHQKEGEWRKLHTGNYKMHPSGLTTSVDTRGTRNSLIISAYRFVFASKCACFFVGLPSQKKKGTHFGYNIDTSNTHKSLFKNTCPCFSTLHNLLKPNTFCYYKFFYAM